MPVKTTHISRVKEEFASNRAYIQKVANLSPLEYQDLEFETGMKFLAHNYPEGSCMHEYYSEHAYSKSYWDWWKAEFANYEKSLVRVYKDNEHIWSQKDWIAMISGIVYHKYLENSFYENYLKIICNGKA